jgi:hypothetical protein
MRVDDNRPSAAEQASKDDRAKQSTKSKDPAVTSQSAQQAGRWQQTKETKSPFDRVLENVSNPNQPAQSEALKFDIRVKDALADQGKGQDKDKTDRKKDKDDDKKTRSSEEKESGLSAREMGHKGKVLGKQHMGGQGSGGGGTSGEQGGSSQHSGQRQLKQGAGAITGVAPSAVQGTFRPESIYATRAAEQVALREIPKQVLDQIVQHIRIGLNKNLDKEIQIDLSDRIFKGLSLKVSSNQGKVEVTFLTGNADVKRLFEKQKEEIGKTLSEKGISVSQIRVQFLG